MKNTSKILVLVLAMALILGMVPMVGAQDGIERVCLITDTGRVNDGTFNQYAYEGMLLGEDELDLEITYIETIAETDYENNINTCIENGYEAIITVGFLMNDATIVAAEANPDIYFIGVDQNAEGATENFAGLVFREDQAGFLAGALAALVAEEVGGDTIGGVYGIDVPAVKKFRNGFENGARYINPDINVLGSYSDSFVDRSGGAATAEQMIGEGAVVIFGAGGQTGSGGIVAAAEQGVYVIGVDQDEYFTTFDSGNTPGAEYLISSAIKRVDLGVFTLLEILAEGEEFPGGTNFVMEAAEEGVGLAEKHDSDVSDEIYEQVAEIGELLASGELETGVDPNTGDMLDADAEATEEAGDAEGEGSEEDAEGEDDED